jgi:parvulin-like peptidyl-prolyl isomerase
MAKRQKQKIMTKKHVARLERERRQKQLLIYGSIALVAIVFIIITIGVVNETIITPRKPIASVGEDVITTKEFQEVVRYQRLQLVNEYINTYEFMQSFDDQNTMSYFQNNLQQIEFQLQPEFLGQGIIDSLIEDRLVRQEAARRGISVSESEIEEAVQTIFGYYPGGTPTPKPTQESVPTSTLSPTQLALVPPTPTAMPTQVVTETAEITPTAEAPEPTATEIPPTPTPYTAAQFDQNYETALDNLDQGINLSEDAFRKIFEGQLFREKVFDAITADMEQNQEQVWARHILVEDEETAQDVMARIESGDDFAELAKELSTDPGSGANGGDLGWFGEGRMVAEFEQAAFSLEIGEISDPVESSFGWHIIQVLGREMRPVDDNTFEQLRQQTFQEWLDTQREAANVEINEEWVNVVPTEPSIPPQLSTAALVPTP